MSASNTTFFQNVAQLLMTSASPKQPQSETGLLRAIHKVSGVIIIIKMKPPQAVSRKRIPKSMLIPIMNSMAEMMMAAKSAKLPS